MLEILTNITAGRAQRGDVELLEELGAVIQQASLCGLGKTAPNPVLSTIRYFRGEYDAHIHDKRCPSGVCRALITFSIDPELCKGCTLCAQRCPQEAIHGEKKQPSIIDVGACIRCGVCRDVCPSDAVVVH